MQEFQDDTMDRTPPVRQLSDGPALALCLFHRPTARIDDLSDDRSAVYGRASQQVKWAPVWRS